MEKYNISAATKADRLSTRMELTYLLMSKPFSVQALQHCSATNKEHDTRMKNQICGYAFGYGNT